MENRSTFYGIYINSFTLFVAAITHASVLATSSALDLIHLRRENDTLKFQSGQNSVISRVPKEIWNEIKLLLVPLTLNYTRIEIAKSIWSECEPVQLQQESIENDNHDDDEIRVLNQDDYYSRAFEFHEDGDIKGCRHHRLFVGGGCEPCKENGKKFFNELYNEENFMKISNLLEKFGFELYSDILCCNLLQLETEGDFRALSPIHSNLHSISHYPRQSRDNIPPVGVCEYTFSSISPDPSLGPTETQALEINQHFKDFMDLYQVSPTRYVSGGYPSTIRASSEPFVTFDDVETDRIKFIRWLYFEVLDNNVAAELFWSNLLNQNLSNI